jgi:nicotinamidase-related amidase
MQTNDWSAFALLLIDVQADFWSEEIAATFPAFQDNVHRLLQFCRAEGIEIVHVRAGFSPDQSDWMVRYRLGRPIPCIEGSAGARTLPCAAPFPGERIITKQSFDAFCNPETDAWLRERGKRFVLAAGLVTSVCVLLTVAAAAQRGYLVGVIEDCCADQPVVHELILERYPFIFERTPLDELGSRRAGWLAQIAAL